MEEYSKVKVTGYFLIFEFKVPSLLYTLASIKLGFGELIISTYNIRTKKSYTERSKIENIGNHSETVKTNKYTKINKNVSVDLIILVFPQFSNKGISMSNNILLKSEWKH